jgi:magnesium-transporting ATPase (P-type)
MISGDNFETATRCAIKAGIIKEAQLSQEDACLTGHQLMDILGGKPIMEVVNGVETYTYPKEIRDVILKRIQNKCKVLARCTPE